MAGRLTWKRAEEEEERDKPNKTGTPHASEKLGTLLLVQRSKHKLKYTGSLWCGQKPTMNLEDVGKWCVNVCPEESW